MLCLAQGAEVLAASKEHGDLELVHEALDELHGSWHAAGFAVVNQELLRTADFHAVQSSWLRALDNPRHSLLHPAPHDLRTHKGVGW